MKISVPQKDGDITLRVGSADPVEYTVTNGTVDVPDGAEAENFLRVVDGAKASDSKPSAEQPRRQPRPQRRDRP